MSSGIMHKNEIRYEICVWEKSIPSFIPIICGKFDRDIIK